MRVTAIGWRAHAALVASAGRADLVAALSGSFYAEAAGELVWIGRAGAPLHPRAVIASDLPAVAASAPIRVVPDGVAPWRPARPRSPLVGPVVARALHRVLTELGAPRGLGVLLARGGGDDPVVARARAHALRLAEACAADDAPAVAEGARLLLGLGPGLTPSGDDFVGGLLFARRFVEVADPTAWDAVVARITADAATLTHPISARLLADLGAGEGWKPLHDLAVALADDDRHATLYAARRLTALGHTSGWDILAGFGAGLGTLPSA